MDKRQFTRLSALSLACAVLPGAAFAQAAARGTLAELAEYEGADRLPRLIAGAKKEGSLSVYTSMPILDMAPLAAGFETKYGIKPTVWRASSDVLLARVLTEARANRFPDIVETNGPELEAIRRERENIFQAIRSPHRADLIPGVLQPHREWTSTRLQVFVQAYNTNLVRKDELPKTWDDLLDPRWKGRLSIEAKAFDWLSAMLDQLGEARGIKLFREIVAANGVSPRIGGTLLTNMVAAGEVPFSLTAFSARVNFLKHSGAPIDWLALGGTAIGMAIGVAVTRQASNPHAALLFSDYMISEEGQSILVGRSQVPTNRKVKVEGPDWGRMPMRMIDAGKVLDQHEKLDKLFQEIFVKRA